MAQDRFRGTQPPPNETLRPSPFRVEIPDMQKLSELVDTYAGLLRKEAITNREMPLDVAQSATGLFSRFNHRLNFNEDLDGFTMNLVATFRHPGMHAWNPDEIDRVEHQLDSHYSTQNVFSADVEGTKRITITDPINSIAFTAFMGFVARSRQIDLRSQGNVTFMNVRNEEEASTFLMVMHALKETDAVFSLTSVTSPLLLPEADPEVFMQRVNAWSQAMERMVNTAAQVKNIPQSGVLYLPNPMLLP